MSTSLLSFFGAAEKSRTSTGLPPLGPQPSASAIPPRPQFEIHNIVCKKLKMVSHAGFEPATL